MRGTVIRVILVFLLLLLEQDLFIKLVKLAV